MDSVVHCQLNPRVRPFVPTVMAPKLAYHRGKREGGKESARKHQIRPENGRWAGPRGVGRLNPRRETKIQGKNGGGERGIKDRVTERRKFLARRRRRRGRAERRLLRKGETRNRARADRLEIITTTHNVRTMAVDGTHGVGQALDVLSVYDRLGLRKGETRNRARADRLEIITATHNVRTMAVDGTHGVGQALDVLSVYDRLGYDVIGLRETRRSGHSAFTQAGYLMYCSGEYGDENEWWEERARGSRTSYEDLYHACFTPTEVYQ